MKKDIDFINNDTGKSLMAMFIPLLFAMILTMIYSMVDSLWVGNMLGENGLSALTAGTAIVLVMSSLSMGMGNGVSVMVAQLIGAGKKNELPAACASIMASSAVVSVLGCVLTEFLVEPILLLMGTPELIINDAALYLKLYLIGNVALFLYMQFTSIFRAFGDSVFQMKGMIITAAFNAVADPFLIKIWGLAGAAIVTVASEVLCLVYAYIYYRKKKYFDLDFKNINMQYVKTMFKLGIPTSIQSVMPALSSAVMVSFVTAFGTQAIAGFGVARNLEYFMFMPTTAMCMAVTTIVGQCNGAKRTDRADDYLRKALLIGGSMIAIISVAVIFFSGNLAAMFGQNLEVSKITEGYFKVLSIGFVLYMITSCLQGYITGMARPGTAMVLLILYYIVFRIPLAVFLKKPLGIYGIWAAFLISHILAALVGIYLYKKVSSEIKEDIIHEGSVL